MLEIIVAGIFIATLFNIIFTRYHIPTIIGYIVTGLVLSYLFGLHSSKSHDLELIAEFGIVFLMFTIGLEFSIKHLKLMRKEIFFYGGLQVGISMAIFFLLARFAADIPNKPSLVIASALALSSTAIVLKLLTASRKIGEEFGRRALGILIFQDIMVIPILLMIGIFSASDVHIAPLLLKTLAEAIVLFAALWAFGLYVLDPFLSRVLRSNSNEIFIGSILFLVMGASLLAHSLSFSYSLGAFIAGMIIAETHYKHQVEADLIPFRDLLLGLFFVTVGMQIDLRIVGDNLPLILGLVALFALIKVTVIYLLLKRATAKRVALKSALSLFQLGEFGLVVFELARNADLIATELSQILISVIIVSMVLTPFVLRRLTDIVDLFFGNEKLAVMAASFPKRDLEDHIVVLGYGRLGQKICDKLESRSIPHIAIEHNNESVLRARGLGKKVILGNAAQSSILESVHVHSATAVVVAMDNNDHIHLVCNALTQIAPETKVIITVSKFQERALLHREFPRYEIIVGTEQIARGIVDSILKCEL